MCKKKATDNKQQRKTADQHRLSNTSNTGARKVHTSERQQQKMGKQTTQSPQRRGSAASQAGQSNRRGSAQSAAGGSMSLNGFNSAQQKDDEKASDKAEKADQGQPPGRLGQQNPKGNATYIPSPDELVRMRRQTLGVVRPAARDIIRRQPSDKFFFWEREVERKKDALKARETRAFRTRQKNAGMIRDAESRMGSRSASRGGTQKGSEQAGGSSSSRSSGKVMPSQETIGDFAESVELRDYAVDLREDQLKENDDPTKSPENSMKVQRMMQRMREDEEFDSQTAAGKKRLHGFGIDKEADKRDVVVEGANYIASHSDRALADLVKVSQGYDEAELGDTWDP